MSVPPMIPATLKLASMENKDSGYSLSDYKKILEKIYVDARRDESRILAKTIQGQLYHSLKPVNPRTGESRCQDRPVCGSDRHPNARHSG